MQRNGSPPRDDDRAPVRLYLRGRIWWTWVYYPGDPKPHPKSTRCTSKRAAAREARRLEEEAQGGAPAAAQDPYSVAQALDRVLDVHEWADRTLWSHESRAGQIARHIGAVDLVHVDRKLVEAFIEARRLEVSDHSIAKELVLLRLALRLAAEEGHWAGVEAAVFPEHHAGYKPRKRWLTVGEAEMLLGALQEHRRIWLQLALYTGGRHEEIDGLRWEHVNFELGLVEIWGTKTEAAERVISLNDDLRALLEGLLAAHEAAHPGERLAGPIAAPWGHAGRDLKRAAARIQTKLRAAQEKARQEPTASFAPVTPNDLRRTCASWMAQKGVPPKAIADWLGHASLDMVMRVYAQVNPLALRPAAAALPSLSAKAADLRRCSTFVEVPSTREPVRAAKTEAPSENPQRAPPFTEWACRDSNAGPLASEAKGNASILPLKTGRRRGAL